MRTIPRAGRTIAELSCRRAEVKRYPTPTLQGNAGDHTGEGSRVAAR